MAPSEAKVHNWRTTLTYAGGGFLSIRVGVLGAGAWAQFAHLPGFKRDNRCEIVAIADPVMERATESAECFGIPHVYSSHAELIAREDIDLVDVCTPSATHFELAWAALAAAATGASLP